MGEIFRIKCNECNIGYDLLTGQGLKDADPSNFIPLFPKDIQLNIEKIISSGSVWNFTRKPAVCGKCKRLTALPVFETYGENPVTVRGICGCGDYGDDAKITEIEAEESTYRCPDCKGTLEITRAGNWD